LEGHAAVPGQRRDAERVGPHVTRGGIVSAKASIANQWQRIWFSIRRHDWNSLALVPSHPATDVVRVAETLAETGRVQGERPIIVINGTGVQLAGVQQVGEAIAANVARGDRVMVTVDPIID